MKRRDLLLRGGSVALAATVGSPFAFGVATVPCPPPLTQIDGDAQSVATVCANGSSTIGYLNSMAPFEVRQLSGSLAPSNGKATMRSTTPEAWLSSDPGDVGLPAILSAWSGGIGDSATNRLFILGGGHGDSANNGIYVYDFSGASAPNGFSIASGSQSAVGAAPTIAQGDPTNYTQYSDGRMSAKHTYDGVVFASEKVYVFGGGSWGAGGFTRDIWRFQGTTWSRMPDPPLVGGTDRPWTAFDPTTKKVLYFNPGGTQFAFYNTSNETWGSVRNLSANFAVNDAVLCHDTSRNRVFVMGSGNNRIGQSTGPPKRLLRERTVRRASSRMGP